MNGRHRDNATHPLSSSVMLREKEETSPSRNTASMAGTATSGVARKPSLGVSDINACAIALVSLIRRTHDERELDSAYQRRSVSGHGHRRSTS